MLSLCGNGQATAAPPKSVTNSRRFIASSIPRDTSIRLSIQASTPGRASSERGADCDLALRISIRPMTVVGHSRPGAVDVTSAFAPKADAKFKPSRIGRFVPQH